ncbi:hypothetical protein BCR35DRAFT_304798 [Leucosporidium creatinivorum]|uniref:HCP-like protein n=1 Tax=Leucosporidium creatinivorum TaxID=106004 RepID=A0A1Y2F7A2_9BASI|nr:hypothetical protein BCR35DRAFT_304798 [Leucosporidium creatinivorum]
MSDKPLPFPGDTSPSNPSPLPFSDHHQQQQQQQRHHRPSQDFFSTTTQPLRDDSDYHPTDPTTPVAPRPRTTSNSSNSVLHRPRPKPARPNSFFGVDQQGDDDQEEDLQGISHRPSVDWNGTERGSLDWNRGGGAAAAIGRREVIDDSDGEGPIGGGARGRASSFFGVRASSPGVESSYGELAGREDVGDDADAAQAQGAAQPYHHGRGASRSSFYGLQAPGGAHSGNHSPGDYSGSHTPTSAAGSQRNLPLRNESGSGSFSSNSHDAPRPPHPNSQPQQPRYVSAPYAASRAASLYGISSSHGHGDPLPAPLLDQSHLRPGALASLLSHEKTLDLYRANARKTNDPDIQFEFCTFVMEVVSEVEAAREAEALASGVARGTTEQDLAAKHKEQALISESVALLNKLAQRGHVKSQYFLADCYTQGVGTAKGKRDYDKAFPLFMLAGKHGHSDACYRAAQCCENAWGCKRDQSKAVQLLRRAAVLNHPSAMHRLGLAEINGELGLSKRPREGVKWLKRAAELADQVDPPQPQSLHELAVLHEKGIENVVFQDEEYAAELLARASELQYAPSAYKLGECYEYGKMGCPQDSALSIHYYNIAAQQNHREACFALTAWYLVGSPGVLPQSDTEAYLWARKAADMDLAKAEYAVGYFTETGIGTHKDAREALEWFKKAANHGDKRAMDRLRMAGQPHSQPFARQPPAPSQPPPTPYKPPPTTKITRKEKKAAIASAKERGKSVDRGRPTNGVQAPQQNGSSRPGPPPMVRQRSASQPDLYAQAHAQQQQQQQWGAQQIQYQQQPQQHSDFAPLSYDDSPYASATMPSSSQHYGRPAPQERQLSNGPPQPGQVRMPQRQQASASPVLGSEEFEKRKGERDKVLQRRKGPGEDKDCVIM